jgi:hypothetical protein
MIFQGGPVKVDDILEDLDIIELDTVLSDDDLQIDFKSHLKTDPGLL